MRKILYDLYSGFNILFVCLEERDRFSEGLHKVKLFKDTYPFITVIRFKQLRNITSYILFRSRFYSVYKSLNATQMAVSLTYKKTCGA